MTGPQRRTVETKARKAAYTLAGLIEAERYDRATPASTAYGRAQRRRYLLRRRAEAHYRAIQLGAACARALGAS